MSLRAHLLPGSASSPPFHGGAGPLPPDVLPYRRCRYGAKRINTYRLHQARSWGQTHLWCGRGLEWGLLFRDVVSESELRSEWVD